MNNLHDLEFLLLPDGRRADSLRLLPLLAELRRLGIPAISGSMSKPQLLERYAEVFGAALKTVPKHHGGPRPLSEIVAKQASAAIAAQSAARDAGERAGNGPPTQPIATTR